MKRPDDGRLATVEAPYVAGIGDELVELRARLLAAGHPEATVHGLLGWLVSKHAGVSSPGSQMTAAKYRRILRELEAPAGPGGGGDELERRRIRRSVAEAGYALTGKPGSSSAASLTALGAGLAATAASGSPLGAIVGVAAYLTERGEPRVAA